MKERPVLDSVGAIAMVFGIEVCADILGVPAHVVINECLGGSAATAAELSCRDAELLQSRQQAFGILLPHDDLVVGPVRLGGLAMNVTYASSSRGSSAFRLRPVIEKCAFRSFRIATARRRSSRKRELIFVSERDWEFTVFDNPTEAVGPLQCQVPLPVIWRARAERDRHNAVAVQTVDGRISSAAGAATRKGR